MVNFETFDLYKAEVKPDFRVFHDKKKWLTKEGFSVSNKIGGNGSPVRATAWN